MPWDEYMAAIAQLGGLTPAAATLECGISTLSRYANRERGVSEAIARKIRALVVPETPYYGTS